MTIDQRYDLPGVEQALLVPVDDFPGYLRTTLIEGLEPLSSYWRDMETEAFRRYDTNYLRVTLDLGDRPLHLFVHEDGDAFQFDAPVFFDFSAHASHFVLDALRGSMVMVSFRLDRVYQNSTGKVVRDSALAQTTRDVLYGWGKQEFYRFVASLPASLPFLINKLTEAEIRLREYLDEPPPVLLRAA